MIGGNRLVDKVRQALSAENRLVVLKMEQGHTAHLGPPGQLATQEARKLTVQQAHPLGASLVHRKTGEEDLRMGQIAGHTYLLQGNAAEAWILDLIAQDVGQNPMQLDTDPFCSCKFAHVPSLDLPRRLDALEDLDIVANLDVIVVLDTDAALHT